jgi:hypothetical protein
LAGTQNFVSISVPSDKDQYRTAANFFIFTVTFRRNQIFLGKIVAFDPLSAEMIIASFLQHPYAKDLIANWPIALEEIHIVSIALIFLD